MKNIKTKKKNSIVNIKPKRTQSKKDFDFVVADDSDLSTNDFIEQTTELEIWKPEDLNDFKELDIKKTAKKGKK